MSTAEELLTATHVHPVPDTDTYFIIDPITRRIENTNRKKSVIMQYDHNSERFTFQLPRYIDGHDMMECTSITVNADNIESETGNTNSDAPDMTDLRLNPDDPETVISSWSISRNLTQLAGILSFSIEYKCVDADGNVVYEWSTDTYDEIDIKARRKNGEAAVIEHTDLLEQWRTRIFGAADSVMTNITAEGEAQVAAIKTESETQQETVEQKGVEVLESIPDDYTETNNMADEAVRSKGDAIVCEAVGDAIAVNNSSNDYIRGLKLFGKSAQFTTTGKNLLPYPYSGTSQNANGATVTVNADGSITFGGTPTDYIGMALFNAAPIWNGTIAISLLGTFTNVVGEIHITDSNGATLVGDAIDSTYSINLDDYADIGNIALVIKRKTNDVAVNGTVYPIIVSGSTPATTYEPYTGGKPSPNPDYPQEIESIEDPLVGIYGRNLIDVDSLATVLNKSLYVSDDKYTVTVVGGSDKTYAYSYYTMPADLVRLLCGREVRLSVDSITKSVSTAYSPVQLNVTTSDKTALYPACHDNKHYHDFILPKNVIDIKVGIYTNNGSSLLETDNTVVVKGLRLTLVDTPEYELYKPYQTFTLPRTLPGIPVTTGGNYTDSDGQQWICDEIDLERGILVQRIAVSKSEDWNLQASNIIESINGLKWKVSKRFIDSALNSTWETVIDRIMTNRFSKVKYTVEDDLDTGNIMSAYGHADGLECRFRFLKTDYPTAEDALAGMAGTIVYYPLATPIETPLTAEEIAAFKALRTNYPNTTILNDADAWMSVKYNADTKSYIENPKILKLTDSSTGVVYELKIVDGVLTVNPV